MCTFVIDFKQNSARLCYKFITGRSPPFIIEPCVFIQLLEIFIYTCYFIEMKINFLLTAAACGSMLLSANFAMAQDAVAVEQEAITVSEDVVCKTHYPTTWRDNWFIQLGAGIQSPFVENSSGSRRITATYNLGVGRWISPYLGFRVSAYYGTIHWNQTITNSARVANLNLDFMWDMFNSIGGFKPNRVFAIVPYVGLGGTFVYKFRTPDANDYNRHGKIRNNQWCLPVSAGLQFRFRLCEYADFFAEGRAQFYGDNFNNTVEGHPLDINLSAIGGFSFYINGRHFGEYNPCDYNSYVNDLNGKVNDLRGQLATTTAALAAAEAQLPCPEVTETVTTTAPAPMLASVRFKINSATIADEEMVHVYNVAQWMKANPDVKVAVEGYADRDTGSSEYNQTLSQRRAQAVVDALVSDYGIDASRLTINAYGSDTQPYETNNWNRIVVFTQQ